MNMNRDRNPDGGRGGEMPYDRGWSYGDQGYLRGGEYDWDDLDGDRGDTRPDDRGLAQRRGPQGRDERQADVSQQTFEYGWGGDGYRPGQQPERRESGYRRPDNRITDDVCDRLTRHGWIDATDIEVRVENGEVTLEGTVDSRRAKRLAGDVADSVSGVQDVHNRLRIAHGATTQELPM